jgi:flagellar biosynthesis GTPase FlhF
LLFHSYRTIDDIKFNESFTTKFRQLYNSNKISSRTEIILQNIQDVRANAARMTNNDDDLRRVTTEYKNSLVTNGIHEIPDDISETITDNQDLNDLLQLLNQTDTDEVETTDPKTIPQEFLLSNIRDRGRFQCGYKLISPMLTARAQTSENTQFIQSSYDTLQEVTLTEDSNISTAYRRQSVTKDDIVKVLLERTSRRRRQHLNSQTRAPTSNTLEANGSAESIFDWSLNANIDDNQRRAFEIFAASFVLTYYYGASIHNRTRYKQYSEELKRLELIVSKTTRKSKQLICLLHGPAGCGKTTIIDLLIEYAREYCNYLSDYAFTTNTIVVTAMSGVAATLLMGETTHSALQLNKKDIDCETVEKWQDTRLVIIDEISFASVNDLKKIYKNICILKQNLQEPFGGVHMIFSGDFRQLEPIGNSQLTLFSTNNSELENWINCYIELNGTHRFSADPEWGHILQRFRSGTVTVEDIDTINAQLLPTQTALPDNIRYATFQNIDRDAINSALFAMRCLQHCDDQRFVNDSILIFCDNIQIKDARNVFVTFHNYNHFWKTCSGADIVGSKGFEQGKGEPVLQLYQSCRVMLPTNINVSNGQANGTQATVVNIRLKSNVTPATVTLDNGSKVRAVYASQVEFIELEHSNKRVQPTRFSLKSIEYRRTVKILKPKQLRTKSNEREEVNMKFTQFPILLNNATTGHKLQGTGVDQLFVHEWKYSVKNWIYVVLSRVTTLRGLYFRYPLSRELQRYSMPDNLTGFIERLSANHAARPWSNQEYTDVINYSYRR